MMKLPLSLTVQREMVYYAQQMAPYECCGLIIDGEFFPVPNVSNTPCASFMIDPRLTIAAENSFEGTMIFHSHPFGPPSPTQSDMEGWKNWGNPWVICSLNGGASELFTLEDTIDTPLLGRVFRSGITDCYDLIRAWFWQERGIELPNFVRSDFWWKHNKDLYAENFEATGFRPLESTEKPIEGDVFLMRLVSPVLNHGGVYLGRSMIMHHLPNRLSRREPLGAWGPRIDRWLRYEGPQV